MNEKYTYLLVDFFCIIFPLIFSFLPEFDFYKHWKKFTLPCIAVGMFFIIWDMLFTHIGVWAFSDKYTIGLRIINLPIEEILFFICIPYASSFSYYCFKKYFKFQGLNKFVKIFYTILIPVLLVIAAFNIQKLYTSVTFILLAVFLSIALLKKWNFLSIFFVCFLFILIPFFISNGILTGSFLNRVVVSYNDNHNLGIRMLTIPVEDTFYGMLLLLMNVAGFEWLSTKKN